MYSYKQTNSMQNRRFKTWTSLHSIDYDFINSKSSKTVILIITGLVFSSPLAPYLVLCVTDSRFPCSSTSNLVFSNGTFGTSLLLFLFWCCCCNSFRFLISLFCHELGEVLVDLATILLYLDFYTTMYIALKDGLGF